jgi:hypothetical protein
MHIQGIVVLSLRPSEWVGYTYFFWIGFLCWISLWGGLANPTQEPNPANLPIGEGSKSVLGIRKLGFIQLDGL